MVNITVKYMSMVRERTGIYKTQFTPSSPKLKDAVEEIVEEYGVQDLILLDDGTIRPWARVILNGRSQDFSVDPNVPLKDGDVIALLYSFPYHENV